MNRVWQGEYTLRAGDFDKFNRIKPSAVLDLFQDAAGQHAVELGLGFQEMLARSYLWALTRIQFKIHRQPEIYQKVRVKTWPLSPGRLTYRREYCIEDLKGNMLLAGSSEWVVIHSEKRRLVSVPDLYPFREGFCTDMMCDEKLSKVADFTPSALPYTVNAGFCDLDVNNHVNNTKYANYVLDAANPTPEERLAAFQIDYRKEVLQGTTLSVYHQKEGNTLLAKGENQDGDILFACKLDYEA